MLKCTSCLFVYALAILLLIVGYQFFFVLFVVEQVILDHEEHEAHEERLKTETRYNLRVRSSFFGRSVVSVVLSWWIPFEPQRPSFASSGGQAQRAPRRKQNGKRATGLRIEEN